MCVYIYVNYDEFEKTKEQRTFQKFKITKDTKMILKGHLNLVKMI